jgi:tetratricopeptide (TPR) repeat protein
MSRCAILVAFAVATFCPVAQGGLYYSGEAIAELPSQWRGFLLDQRALRNAAAKPTAKGQSSPLRLKYEAAVSRLEKAARQQTLSADEQADLGALYVRLGEVDKALSVLRDANGRHPNHFRIVANLGTAWQLQGDPDQAAHCLRQAVRLAPGKLQKAEEYQLKLVLIRQRQARDVQTFEDLFGISFVGESGQYEAGKLAAAERKKLPSEAVATIQQLALWLPADGRILWQLAELANAHGDVKIAAAILDGCVSEFGLHAPELRRHRQLLRSAAEELAKNALSPDPNAKAAHEGHAGVLRPRSKRPLADKLASAPLPPIHADGINSLPWDVLAETTLGKQFKPTFAKYLRELDGRQIALTGFIQPLGEDLELGTFMLIEYPVGCWYCEMPEMIGIVFVELPEGKTATFRRSLVKVEGTLKLNSSDPENFLYTISKAKVSEAD